MTAPRTPDVTGAFRNRVVAVTGHTGFKGAWLSLWLQELGARTIGFSKSVPTEPSAFEAMNVAAGMEDHRGDIRDAEGLTALFAARAPEVVFHLAAQPIVRTALASPLETFAVNVLGTAAVLEAARRTPSVRAVVVVTSDKVYDNDGSGRPFTEEDRLGGHEPYGASKAAAEIVAAVYRSAGFHRGAASPNAPAVATARAGNVIGGGDWARDRLLPDCVRAIACGEMLTIRQPHATRPWQHVLEPLNGYLTLAAALLEDPEGAPAALNFGPAENDAPTVAAVARRFFEAMGASVSRIVIDEDLSGAEAKALRVASHRAAQTIGWRPVWRSGEAILRAAEWHRAHAAGDDVAALGRAQIAAYAALSPSFRNAGAA